MYYCFILHVSRLFFTNSFYDYNLSSGSAFFGAFFSRVNIDIEKYADCLQSNNDSLNDLWLLFLNLGFSVQLFLHNHIKTPYHHEAIRSCSKEEFFTLDYIDTCENIKLLGTQLTIDNLSISKLKDKNFNSFF